MLEEPDPEMRRVAEIEYGRDARFASVAGTAENTILPDRSVDLIVVGNAIHRFDAPRAKREFDRIIKPGGWLAIVGYDRPSPDLSDFLEPRLSRLTRWKQRMADTRSDVRPSDYFDAEQPVTFNVECARDENLVDFVGAALAGMESPEPGDPEYEAFVDTFTGAFRAKATGGVLRMRYTTEVAMGVLLR